MLSYVQIAYPSCYKFFELANVSSCVNIHPLSTDYPTTLNLCTILKIYSATIVYSHASMSALARDTKTHLNF